MPVPAQDILAGKDDLFIGDSYKDRETDDARKGQDDSRSAHTIPIAHFYQFCLTEIEQDDSFLDVDDTHGLVILVQNQNLGVQPPG